MPQANLGQRDLPIAPTIPTGSSDYSSDTLQVLMSKCDRLNAPLFSDYSSDTLQVLISYRDPSIAPPFSDYASDMPKSKLSEDLRRRVSVPVIQATCGSRSQATGSGNVGFFWRCPARALLCAPADGSDGRSAFSVRFRVVRGSSVFDVWVGLLRDLPPSDRLAALAIALFQSGSSR